jgi:transketolase
MWKESVRDILNCTTLAACGHPGGSMSSIHLLLVLYAMAGIRPENSTHPDRDRIVVSHGHISPGVYSALARFGFFDSREMVLHFRRMGARYAGHVESSVPGVEWNTGNLGQGISAAVGFALAAKSRNSDSRTVVLMGDGEQQKGQISEARRVAVKFGLSNLIGIIDFNRFQIGGSISSVMPQNIAENYHSDGWNVLLLEHGHDPAAIFQTLKKAWNRDVSHPDRPTLILARTQMGYGVSFMTDGYDFHGRACKQDEHDEAFRELGLENTIEQLRKERAQLPAVSCPSAPFSPPEIRIDLGDPIVYEPDVLTDNRSAYGAALADLAKRNNGDLSLAQIAGVSCDLEGSVKMNAFRKVSPDRFFECGIQEHHAAVMAGALSKEGFQVFFSTFGIFGVDEVFNQQRLNAFNNTNVKTVCTHLGLSVGEDGPTHQAIHYIGLLRNIPRYSVFLPADPNQTDHMIRYVAGRYGNFFVGMGRAKTPVIVDERGRPFFGAHYRFVPGKADVLKKGNDAALIAVGPMLDSALKVARKLEAEKSLDVRVINMGSVIPPDREAVIAAARDTGVLVTVEDHFVETGLGSVVDRVLVEERLAPAVAHLGVRGFVGSGTPPELYASQGMSPEAIEKRLKELVRR